MDYQILTIIAGALSIVAILTSIWGILRTKRLDKFRQEFYVDETQRKIDEVLVEHNQSIKKLSGDLSGLGDYVKELSQANKKNFQKIGFIRFNPFGDTGGSISFILALLDADDNGFVLSSLHGREGNRVYAKEVHKGISKSQLTEEEKEAIKSATVS